MGFIDRVRGLFRGQTHAPLERAEAAPGRAGSVLPSQSLWEQFGRIGGGVTPATVSNIIRAADGGDPSLLIDLGNESRQRDGHLHSVLQTREIAVASLPWELIIDGQKKRSSRGARQRSFCEKALRGNREFRRLLAHLSGAFYPGYAVGEMVWVNEGGKLLPKSFLCHSPRRFGFRREDGLLVWRERGGQEIDFRRAWPDKFITSQPRVNGDVPCREGLLRVLMWLALFRNWSLSDLLKLAELAWKPWRIGVYKKTASKEDRDNLESILAGMTSSGAALHSEAVEVQFKWPEMKGGSSSGQGGTHEGLFDICGREMSKAVLGQTLTTEAGKIGSQALGNVHDGVRRDILEADAVHLAEVITRDIIEPMVRLNFGPTAPVPTFRFITEEFSDIESFATAIATLSGPDVKLKISADYVRDKVGIPKPDAEDELVGHWVDVDVSDLGKPANDTPPPVDEPADEAA